MSVDNLKCSRIGYREVVWCDTDERPCRAKFRCRLEDPKSNVGAYRTSRASGGPLLNGAPVWRRGLTTGQRSGQAGGQGTIAGHVDQ